MDNIRDLYKDCNLSEEQLQELEDYQKRLNDDEKNHKPGDKVLNANAYLASLLITKLLKNTTKNLRMVVGRFDGNVSNIGGYADALENCLKNNVKAEVIFMDEEINKSSKAFRILKKYKDEGKDIEIRKASDETKKKLSENFEKFGKNVHFSTFDSKMFRTEIVPQTYAAFASFNDEAETKKYIDLFGNLFSISNPISL